jgi:hypothetical protein
MTADDALAKRRDLLAIASGLPAGHAIRVRCEAMARQLARIARGVDGARSIYDEQGADFENFVEKRGFYAPDYKPSGDPIEILRQIRAGS